MPREDLYLSECRHAGLKANLAVDGTSGFADHEWFQTLDEDEDESQLQIL